MVDFSLHIVSTTKLMYWHKLSICHWEWVLKAQPVECIHIAI